MAPANAAKVINRLITTARDLGAPGRDDVYGYGEVDPVAALTAPVAQVTGNPLTLTAGNLVGPARKAGRWAAVVRCRPGRQPPPPPRSPPVASAADLRWWMALALASAGALTLLAALARRARSRRAAGGAP